MNQQVLQPFEEVWKHHFAALEEALAETIAELEVLLRVDEHNRHGHDPSRLERDLGPFAATNVDLNSLSRVIADSKGSQAMPAERLSRIQALISALSETTGSGLISPVEPISIEADHDEQEIVTLAEKHLDRVAQVFGTLRKAQLEVRSKYEPQTHDAIFSSFSWRQLGPAELRLCPPFLVTARLDHESGPQLRKMMSVLESRMPIKVAALRSSLRETHSATSDTSVPSTMTLETLPLAMRGVYFLQTCVAAADFQKQLFDGLTAPRPGVISLLCPRDGETQTAFEQRAERAVRSRAFPMCVYDPDRATSFVGCFDPSSNPSPDAIWATETISGRDAQGESVEVEEPFTFAHFAASEPEFEAELSHPPAVDDDMVPMAEYLEFSRRQQVGKLPFVSLLTGDGRVVRRVVSHAIALQCSERLHLWRTLQEISGIDNPHVHTSRAALEKELGVQQQAELENLRQEMEQSAATREQAAVASALRRLVAHLTGVEPPSS